MKSIDLSGEIFGNLTVLRITNQLKTKRKRWLCQCKCGKQIDVLQYSLRRGATISCGCRKKELGKDHPNWNGYKEITGSQWALIKNNAKNRDIEFSISIEYAWEIFEKQNGICVLTNRPLIFSKSYNRELKYSSREETTASLDRIDSTKGYVEGNVQWIHKDVNLMKGRLTQDRFIELCKLISNNHLLEKS